MFLDYIDELNLNLNESEVTLSQKISVCEISELPYLVVRNYNRPWIHECILKSLTGNAATARQCQWDRQETKTAPAGF